MQMKRSASELQQISEEDEHEESKTRRATRKRTKTETPTSEPGDVETQRETLGPILYVPGELLPPLSPHINSHLEIHISSVHLTRDNDQVFDLRQIWGDQTYTDDSDIVAILHHTGHYTLPKAGETPRISALVVVLKILPGLDTYQSKERNNLKSRAWGRHEVSLEIERCKILTEENRAIKDLMMKSRGVGAAGMGVGGSETVGNGKRKLTKKAIKAYQEDDDEFRKYHVDVSSESTVIQYNLCNEPCFQYNLNLVLDRGSDPTEWTSYRLRSLVLYLETRFNRYELAREGTILIDGIRYDTYRWARVLNPYKTNSAFMRSEPVPLQEDQIECIEQVLDWSQIKWGTDSVNVNGKEYQVGKIFWFPRSKSHLNNGNTNGIREEEKKGQEDKKDVKVKMEGQNV